jgi:hypothetical protein
MDVYSTELGIWLSFDKTSEFRGEGGVEPPKLPLRYATDFFVFQNAQIEFERHLTTHAISNEASFHGYQAVGS